MPLSIKLESVSGKSLQEIAKIASGVISFGREPENTIVIDSSAISRRHGCMFQTDLYWIYYDLGSTNNSYVNGIRVPEGQFRLLRDGDIVQLADFFVRVSYFWSKPEHEQDGTEHLNGIQAATHPFVTAQTRTSILMFANDTFAGEFIFNDANPVFRFGGHQGMLLADQPTEGANFSITAQNNRMELKVDEALTPVIVNGSIVWGTTSLSDRDEVQVSHYRFLVNNAASSAVISASAEHVPSLSDHVASGTQVPTTTAQAYTKDHLPAQLRTRPPAASDGWESESAKRRLGKARNFVFSSANRDNLGMTLALPIDEFESQAGFEMNPALRFSMIFEDEKSFKPGERFFGYLVTAVVALFAFLAVFIWLQWQ